MHILHVDLGREMRGGQHQVLLLLKALKGAGHSFTLMARGGSPLLAAARALRLNVCSASLLEFRKLSAEYDVVHAHDARAHTWAAFLSRRPFVVSRRVAFAVADSAVSRWKYGRAARYLAVSQYVGAQLEKAGVTPNKIDVVYDAVELRECGVRSQDGAVVALASRDLQKGRDLVEGASKFISRTITFSSDLVRDLEGAAAFVYISRLEGLGSAALLAMSMGVPVIASNVGGMTEIFEDGVSGILVDNDALAIARAVERILMDAELARSMAEQGRARVAKLFSPSCLLLRTLASYRRAIGL